MALLSLEGATFEAGGRVVLAALDWSVRQGEQWAIVGPNASGKSLLLRALAGGLVLRAGRLRHHFLDDDPRCRDSVYGVLPRATLELVSPGRARRLVEAASPFHQARWHATEAHGARVSELLTFESIEQVNPFAAAPRGPERAAFDADRRRVLRLLDLAPLLERRLLELSNGELRRLVLGRALCRAPRLLLLDDPFTGLDLAFREHLREVVASLIAEGQHVIVGLRETDPLPAWVTHIAALEAGRFASLGPRPVTGRRVEDGGPERTTSAARRVSHTSAQTGEPLIELHEVRVCYGERPILDGIDWTVRRGEHWALVGPNGSGKSTLLSLLLGDNPLAYANDVRLFGRRRGSGESIWELRRRIGWTGPELDVHFPSNVAALAAVASGFSGTLGLDAGCDSAQRARARALLQRLDLEDRAQTPLALLTVSERRLVLIARALVAGPELLILDEPCQGLDGAHVLLVKKLVDEVADSSVGSVLYVTHERGELPTCLTHRLALDAGRVVSRGPLDATT